MISSVAIRNFRSIRDATLKLGGRNVLIGPNKSGKTNFLDALRFLRHAVSGGDVTLPLNERGGMEGVGWRGSHAALSPLARPSIPLELRLQGELNQSAEAPQFSYGLEIAADLRGQAAIQRETLDLTTNDIGHLWFTGSLGNV